MEEEAATAKNIYFGGQGGFSSGKDDKQVSEP